MNARVLRLLILLLAAALVTGCASSDLSPDQARVQERATRVALSMVGTPYRYGGNSPQRGFDCSGLVHYSYGRAGMRVPRNTARLRRASYPISMSDMRRGDLLFFNQEGKRSSHVAIYVGKGRFIHAPSSGKKVHVARINRYWKDHLNEIRRFEVD